MSALTATAVAVAMALAACGGKKHEVTQAAARVDGTEITVHEISYRLQRERGPKSEPTEAAGRRVLEQLIDEQLVVEKAEKARLDKDPQAMQALAAARREVLARAWVETLAQAVQTPTEDALHRYYDNNDALFKQRAVYTLDEFLARVPPAQLPALKALVDAGKSPADVGAWLKQQNLPFRNQQSVQPAERLPLAALPQFAALPDGHALMVAQNGQVHLTFVVSRVAEPVTYDRAKLAITQFLLADARRKATESSVAALRSSARIQYMAPYEALAASSATNFTTRDVDAGVPVAASGATRVSLPDVPASGVQVTLPNTAEPGVRVSLPATPASGVEVHVPSQAGADAGKQ